MTGPDGALWFTDDNADTVGRITLAGIVTQYPVPTAGSRPSSIKLGSDGALWCTEYNANKIARVSLTL